MRCTVNDERHIFKKRKKKTLIRGNDLPLYNIDAVCPVTALISGKSRAKKKWLVRLFINKLTNELLTSK